MRSALLPALLVSCGLSAFAACSSDDAPITGVDAGGGEGGLLGEAATPPADVEIPIGDTCGDSMGLAPNSSWPMRGGCPKRGGVAKTAGPADANIAWSFALRGSKSTPVTDASGLVWIGTAGGDVYALRRNGDIQSTFHTGGAIDSSPAVDEAGRTVLVSGDGTLYAFAQAFPIVDGGIDAATDEAGTSLSRVILSRSIGASGESPAIGADGTIYIGTHDGKMNAVAGDFSAVKWSVVVGGDASATLAPDGTVYAGSSDGKLYALDANGAVKWSVATGGPIAGPPAISGDEQTIYVASADGKLYAIDTAGKTRWTYAAGGPIKGTPAVLGGTVYVGSDDKKLHAVQSDTGTVKWAYPTLGAVASPVVGKDGIVYAGSTDGHLYALTPGGSLYFAVNVKGAVSGPPAFGSDGSLYVATNNALVAISR